MAPSAKNSKTNKITFSPNDFVYLADILYEAEP